MSKNEPLWDFNAPTFVDFNVPEVDDKADEWFDNIENNPQLGDIKLESSVTSITEDLSDSQAITITHVQPVIVQKSESEIKPVVAHENCNTDLDTDTKIVIGGALGNQSTKASASECSASLNSSDPSLNGSESSNSSLVISQPASGSKQSADSDVDSARTESQASTTRVNTPAMTRPSSAVKDKTKPNKLTLPTTPMCLKRRPLKSSNTITTEDLEVQKVAEFKKQLKEKKKMAQNFYAKAKNSTGHQPVKGAMKATKVQEFTFETDHRVKVHQAGCGGVNGGSTDFKAKLRSYDTSQNQNISHKTQVTVPKPFHLSSDNRKRRSADPIQNKYMSDAEKVLEFASKTPDRFRSRPHNKEATPLRKRQRSKSSAVTIATTPNLETKSRKRNVTCLSNSQKEDQQVEDMKRFCFKANPVEVFSNPNHAAKKRETRSTTETAEFEFQTDKRIQQQHEKHQDALQASTDLTVNTMDHGYIVKANPIPHNGVPFKPVLPHKTTQQQPFKVDERSQEMMAKRQQKIDKVLDEERKARIFHAKPIGDLKANLPPKVVRPATEIEPFILETYLVGEQKVEAWNQKMEDEQKELLEQINFKAKSATVLESKPFAVKKSQRPLTDVSEFELNTNRRAEEREVFETHKRLNEMEAEERREQRERERLFIEQEDTTKMRLERVHKPNPIKRYRTVEVQRSEKSLTDACSPLLQTKLRSKVRK